MELTKVRNIISQSINETNGRFEFKPTVKCLVSFVGCLLMMNPFVLGQLSPFAVSLVCALDNICTLWATAGGIVGAFLFFNSTQIVKYIAVLLLCVLVKGVSDKFFTAKSKPYFTCIIAGASTFLIGTAVMLATGFDTEEFLGTVFESVLAFCGTHLLKKSGGIIWGKRDLARLTTSETAVILTTFGVVLMHFYKYTIVDFSPVILIFCACTLLFAKIKNGVGGATCGICLAFVAGVSGSFDFFCLGLAMGGFLGGELIRKSRHACAIGFVVPICLCAVADSTIESYMAILESVLAASAFLVVPEEFFVFLSEKFNSPVPVIIQSEDNQKIISKLKHASEAINGISDCVDTVRSTLKPIPQNQLNSSVKCAWQKVCAQCELRESCRAEVKNPTDETINKISSALLNHAELDKTKFPKGFFASCYCFGQMQESIKEKYNSFTANQGVQGQLDQIRGLMSDQFRNMANILLEFSDTLGEEYSISPEVADLCGSEAHELGLNVIGTAGKIDRLGRITIIIDIDIPNKNFNVSKLTENLSTAVGTALDLPQLEEHKDCHTLIFKQKIAYSVTVGAFSRSATEGNVCGDYYRSFRDTDDRYIAILSDGMGTGGRAAIDSAMAAELFSRLIKSDLSFDCALSVANSALLVKGEDESLATLDIVCIDLYTGKADICKAGAAATFIRHRDNVFQIEQASMPLGILREIHFEKISLPLESGDVVLMVSDGILGECNGWIQQELKLWDTGSSPQKLAQFIVDSACERKLTKHRDDMTAVAIYIG